LHKLRGGDHYDVDWAAYVCMTHGVKSCVRAWAAAYTERRPLSVTHSAVAAAGVWLTAL